MGLEILVVSQYFWPENFRINDLVKEWMQRGHKVTILTGAPNYPMGKVFEEYLEKPTNFNQFGVAKIIRVPIIPRGTGRLSLTLNYLSFIISGILWGTWKLRNCKPDVIFVYEPSPVTVGLPAVWLGKLKKIPVVFWALDLWPDTLAALGVVRSPFVLRLIGLVVSFIYNRCTLVMGQSRGFIESITKYCHDKDKIRYFPSWAEELFTDQDVRYAPEISRWENGLTIVFSGNIGIAQDMPAVLDAAEQLKAIDNIRWIFVGDGRKSDWLKEEVIKRELQERIFLPGRYPIERMKSFYAHANVLLVTLKRDPVFCLTIPGKVATYLMTGIPLLGMLDGAGAEVINEARAGLTCAAGDSKGLAKRVLEFVSMSAEKRKLIGENGKAYALKEFERNQLMDRMETLLGEAINIGNLNYRNKNKH